MKTVIILALLGLFMFLSGYLVSLGLAGLGITGWHAQIIGGGVLGVSYYLGWRRYL